MDSIYKKMLLEHGISDLYPSKGLNVNYPVYGYRKNQQFKLCDENIEEIHFEEVGLSEAFVLIQKKDNYVLLDSLDEFYYKNNCVEQSIYVCNKGFLSLIYDCLLSPNKSFILFSLSPNISTKDIVSACALDMREKSLCDVDDDLKFNLESRCHNKSVSIIVNGTMISDTEVIAILELDGNWKYLLLKNSQDQSLFLFSESGEIIKRFPSETVCFKCWTWGNECLSLFFKLKGSADFLYLTLPNGKSCNLSTTSIITTNKVASFFYQDFLILNNADTYEVINQEGEILCHERIRGDREIIKVENGIIVFMNKWYDEVVSHDELMYDKSHPHYEYTFFNLKGTWLGNTGGDMAVLSKTIQSPYDFQNDCIDLKGLLRVSDCKLIIPFLFDDIEYVIYDDQDFAPDSVWSIVSQKSSLGQKLYGLFHNSKLIIPLQECRVGNMRYTSLRDSSDYFYFYIEGKYRLIHKRKGLINDSFDELIPVSMPKYIEKDNPFFSIELDYDKREMEDIIKENESYINSIILVKKDNQIAIMKDGEIVSDYFEDIEDVSFPSNMESGIFYTHNRDFMGVYVCGEGEILSPCYKNIIYSPLLKLIIADNNVVNLSGDCFFYVSETESVRFFQREKKLYVLLNQNLYSIDTTVIDPFRSDEDDPFEQQFLYYSSLIVDAEGNNLYYDVHNDSYIIYSSFFGDHIIFDYEGNEIIDYKTSKDGTRLLIEQSYIYDVESNYLYEPYYPNYNNSINEEDWEDEND